MAHTVADIEYDGIEAKSPDNDRLERGRTEDIRVIHKVGDRVLVENHSHDDPEDHRHVVKCKDGVPVDCSCPDMEYNTDVCKHVVAVARMKVVANYLSDEF